MSYYCKQFRTKEGFKNFFRNLRIKLVDSGNKVNVYKRIVFGLQEM